MNFIKSLKDFNHKQKESFIFFLVSYFFALFNYPLVRASTTSTFLEVFGAKSSPQAWLWTVVFLSLAVSISNWLQSRLSVQRVFLIISSVSAIIFYFTKELSSIPFMGFLPFIWKDIYIVLQIHLLLAFVNQALNKEVFKRLVGPIGAVGSLGGVAGGLLTSYLSSTSGTGVVIVVASFCVLLPGFIFLKTHNSYSSKEESASKVSPMMSFTPEIKKYVFYIALVVALTQFVINIADFQFNLSFEQNVTGLEMRTEYLGHLYSLTNFLSLILQFFFVPLILTRVKERNFHYFIPISYFLGHLLLMGFGGGFWGVAGFYLYLKSSDYSFFSSAKELLYQPLNSVQKYGAKYITDMLVYRFSKALIALVLIYVQSLFMINILMVLFLTLWILAVTKLFEVYPKQSSE